MKHTPIAIITLLVTSTFISFSIQAKDLPPLKQVMKKINFIYFQSMKTESPSEFNIHIKHLNSLLPTTKSYSFHSSSHKKNALEGINKVIDTIQNIPIATDENLNELQLRLKKIDDLRKTYHKKAKPSFWQTLFS
jgi:soluble cytochrome b562